MMMPVVEHPIDRIYLEIGCHMVYGGTISAPLLKIDKCDPINGQCLFDDCKQHYNYTKQFKRV